MIGSVNNGSSVQRRTLSSQFMVGQAPKAPWILAESFVERFGAQTANLNKMTGVTSAVSNGDINLWANRPNVFYFSFSVGYLGGA